ncbi:molybdenum cofactor biosynthesis protein MoaE [Asticcacaulis sp. AC402]|uniref:molybdenum cofactor biosynthesis protein MoaE n=1 Tax=Asticcacaulis sp. AC402 TaxID=1282361 RepID=UPI0003C4073F|nr:molybdenum cofactor biosynthesis protein MoaE [Asticcacaulis sp. AC402]ESQ75580.1 molybdopterin synthase [Asticcacaulis sp. AC402]
MVIQLLEKPLNAAAAHAEFLVEHGHHGAVAAFTGVVRSEAQEVNYLYLDWYPGMTEASIRDIVDAAQARFDLCAVTVLHRCGRVETGEPVVFVAAASVHRRAAFDAVDYMMDRLKSEAALWKREVGDGVNRWVEPRADDAVSLKRWS